jgi:hypothetical protein
MHLVVFNHFDFKINFYLIKQLFVPIKKILMKANGIKL